MLIKLSSPQSWSLSEPPMAQVKMGSHGLRGHDREVFVKRAGHAFVDMLDNVKMAKGEIPIHLIALASTEGGGSNRNGDAFDEQDCIGYHDTFQKYARLYRDHNNKADSPSYGVVKLSTYNKPMRRIELIVAANETKEAADRNKGFIADREIEQLAKYGEFPVSMACKIAYDVCSFCGNKAKTRDEYCDESMCKAGGCKRNLGRIVKVGGDMHHVFVRNPRPHWFDISDVFKPADPNAYAAGADYLHKAASEGWSQEWYVKAAAQMSLPDHLIGLGCSPWVAERMKVATALARIYSGAYSSTLLGTQSLMSAFSPEFSKQASFLGIGRYGDPVFADYMTALADYRIVLPIHAFAKAAARESQADYAATILKEASAGLAQDACLEDLASESSAVIKLGSASWAASEWAKRFIGDFSLDQNLVRDRATMASIRGYKQASAKNVFKTDDAVKLARDYLLYQSGALARIASLGGDFALTAQLAAIQNQAA